MFPLMAEIKICEPFELYNLLNQSTCVPRLAEINYLCLVDARESLDYNTSHIITAKNAKMDAVGRLLFPEPVELDSTQHVVVYDGNTRSLGNQGRAVQWAKALAKVSLNPVYIVRGGFQRFSALYTFLRTEKTLYTIMELENLKTYPVEVIAGALYMGDQSQAMDGTVLKDLKISAIVNISDSDTVAFTKGNQTILGIPADDCGLSDLFASFQRICTFIYSHMNRGSRVLIVSRWGRSRSSAVTIAFLMHRHKQTLKDAWKHLLRCKPNMRPNTGFLKQLSAWELQIMGATSTDISELDF